MRHITFDIETKNIFQEVGSNDPRDLDISVVCLHDSKDGSYQSFFEKDFNKMWPILEEADALITWNGDHFDIPLLDKYYPGDLTKIKSIDLMKEIQDVLGRRLKLDSVAGATLGTKKSGHGLEAVEWWKSGELDKLVKYCIDDVRITRELYEFALAKGHLKFPDAGSIREVRLNTKGWETPAEHAMTFTLPF